MRAGNGMAALRLGCQFSVARGCEKSVNFVCETFNSATLLQCWFCVAAKAAKRSTISTLKRDVIDLRSGPSFRTRTWPAFSVGGASLRTKRTHQNARKETQWKRLLRIHPRESGARHEQCVGLGTLGPEH